MAGRVTASSRSPWPARGSPGGCPPTNGSSCCSLIWVRIAWWRARVHDADRQHVLRSRRPADLDVVDPPGAVSVGDQLLLVRPPVVWAAVRMDQHPEVLVRALEARPPAGDRRAGRHQRAVGGRRRTAQPAVRDAGRAWRSVAAGVAVGGGGRGRRRHGRRRGRRRRVRRRPPATRPATRRPRAPGSMRCRPTGVPGPGVVTFAGAVPRHRRDRHDGARGRRRGGGSIGQSQGGGQVVSARRTHRPSPAARWPRRSRAPGPARTAVAASGMACGQRSVYAPGGAL